MKKGFTLAEVLITLMIIGVVAAITIPTLISNINDSILRNQRKTVAAKVAEGFSNMMAHGALAEKYENTQEFVDAMKKYFNISQVCDSNNLGNCFAKTINMVSQETTMTIPELAEGFGSDINNIKGIKFADGTGMLINYHKKMAGLLESDSDKIWYEKDSKTDDMIYAAFGFSFSYMLDVNDDKGPNTLGKDLIGDLRGIFDTFASELYSGYYNIYLENLSMFVGRCNDEQGYDCFEKESYIFNFDGIEQLCFRCKNIDKNTDKLREIDCGWCTES